MTRTKTRVVLRLPNSNNRGRRPIRAETTKAKIRAPPFPTSWVIHRAHHSNSAVGCTITTS